jgi:hypothetical protein
MSGNSPSSAGSGLGVSFFQSLLRKGQQD